MDVHEEHAAWRDDDEDPVIVAAEDPEWIQQPSGDVNLHRQASLPARYNRGAHTPSFTHVLPLPDRDEASAQPLSRPRLLTASARSRQLTVSMMGSRTRSLSARCCVDGVQAPARTTMIRCCRFFSNLLQVSYHSLFLFTPPSSPSVGIDRQP